MTYKLIKLYPGSPKLGIEAFKRKKESLSYTIRVIPPRGESTYSCDYIRKDKIEEFPEFWEKIN